MESVPSKTFKAALVFKQSEISQFIRELRQLMQLTQVQLAAALGVAYETINRWENEEMQASPLALRQIRFVIDQLILFLPTFYPLDSRGLIAFVVEQAGATVKTAATAVEAIAMLMQSQLNVLLSDIGMPDMDGYMLMQQVRALPPKQNGQLVVISLTVYTGDFNQQQAIQAGFQQHLSKPVEPEVLVKAIATLLRSNP